MTEATGLNVPAQVTERRMNAMSDGVFCVFGSQVELGSSFLPRAEEVEQFLSLSPAD